MAPPETWLGIQCGLGSPDYSDPCGQFSVAVRGRFAALLWTARRHFWMLGARKPRAVIRGRGGGSSHVWLAATLSVLLADLRQLDRPASG